MSINDNAFKHYTGLTIGRQIGKQNKKYGKRCDYRDGSSFHRAGQFVLTQWAILEGN